MIARTPAAAVLAMIVATTASASSRPTAQTFTQLHGNRADVPALVAQLQADIDAAFALDPPEGAASLNAAVEAILAENADLPSGFRAVLASASVAGSVLENPARVRSLLAHSAYLLIQAPEPFSVEGPEVFPRVLRGIVRRTRLPNLIHAERLAVLQASVGVLRLQSSILPDAGYSVGMFGLINGSAVADVHPGAALLSATRGLVSFFPSEGSTGRSVFLKAAVEAAGGNTPPVLARSFLTSFAFAAVASDYFQADDKAVFGQALETAGSIGDASEAAAVLRGAFEALAQ